MTKKILITGASGFIATHVAKLCVQESCEVVLQTRGNNSVCNDLVDNKLVGLLPCSIFSLTSDMLDSVDSIIHLASAGVSPQKASWNVLEEVNIRGMLAISRLALKLKSKLIVAGSCAEYGNGGLKYDQIPVNAPLEPTFPYATSKAAGCNLALGFARSEGLLLAYLRIFNAFGRGQHASNLWPALMQAGKSDKDFEMTKGEQIRDFVPVEDVAKHFFTAATDLELRKGSPYLRNVGSGNPMSVRDFSEHWWRRCGAKGCLKIGSVPYRDNEVMRFIPSLEPAYL